MSDDITKAPAEAKYCDHCGAPRSVATERCGPPFERQPHQWTGRHPADRAEAQDEGAAGEHVAIRLDFNDETKRRIQKVTDREIRSAEEEKIAAIVEEQMLDVWNDICIDTGCHPLDIKQLGRKRLEFRPRHWARMTGECAAHRIAALHAHPSPPPAADEDRVRIAARALLDACVTDFGDPAEFKGDDGAVAASKDGDCAVTFKHMRDLDAALKSEGK